MQEVVISYLQHKKFKYMALQCENTAIKPRAEGRREIKKLFTCLSWNRTLQFEQLIPESPPWPSEVCILNSTGQNESFNATIHHMSVCIMEEMLQQITIEVCGCGSHYVLLLKRCWWDVAQAATRLLSVSGFYHLICQHYLKHLHFSVISENGGPLNVSH